MGKPPPINMLGNETVGLGINKFKNENYSGADLQIPGIKIIASVNKMRIFCKSIPIRSS